MELDPSAGRCKLISPLNGDCCPDQTARGMQVPHRRLGPSSHLLPCPRAAGSNPKARCRRWTKPELQRGLSENAQVPQCYRFTQMACTNEPARMQHGTRTLMKPIPHLRRALTRRGVAAEAKKCDFSPILRGHHGKGIDAAGLRMWCMGLLGTLCRVVCKVCSYIL